YLSMVRFFQKRLPEAIDAGERATSIRTNHHAGHVWLARAHMLAGNDISVLEETARGHGGWGGWSRERIDDLSGRFQSTYSQGGRKKLVESWLEGVNNDNQIGLWRYNRALWYVWIGDPERALLELEAGALSKPYLMVYVNVDPAFAELHSNRRFREVV